MDHQLLLLVIVVNSVEYVGMDTKYYALIEWGIVDGIDVFNKKTFYYFLVKLNMVLYLGLPDLIKYFLYIVYFKRCRRYCIYYFPCSIMEGT